MDKSAPNPSMMLIEEPSDKDILSI